MRESYKIFHLIIGVSFSLILTLQSNATNKVSSYNTRNISENIFIHTDRDIYIAGEKLFFKIYLQSKNNPLLEDNSRIVYLLIRNVNKKNIITTRLWLSNNTCFGNIYLPDTLSTGLYQIVSYTNWMLGANEDCFFTKDIIIANRFDENFQAIEPINNQSDSSIKTINDSAAASIGNSNRISLKIISDKLVYAPKEKIKIDALFSSLNSDDSIAEVSISISERNAFLKNQNETFLNNCYNSYKEFSKICYNRIESKGLIISGKINHIDSLNIERKNIFLSTPDSVVNIQHAVTDSIGQFNFMLSKYYEGKDLYFSFTPFVDDEKAIIQIDDKYKINKPFIPSLKEQLHELKRYLTKCQKIVTISKTYEIENSKILPNTLDFSYRPQLYSKPDYRIYPADYLPLKNFTEITNELLFGVKLRKKPNYSINILDSRLKQYIDNDAFIFLDGVPFSNVKSIINYGTEQVKYIDVINATWVLDKFSFPGILAIFTHKKEINNIRENRGQIVIPFGEFLPKSTFQEPNYSTTEINNRFPDFRQLLYWNPQTLLRKGKSHPIYFFSSNLCTEYLIKVTGFTLKGEYISAQLVIKIDE